MLRIQRNNKGFSLVELMVVISIFLIITGVVFANLPNFRDKSFLQLIAQEIAVTIRQAQVFGVATRVSLADFDKFPSHGIYINLFESNNSFIFFSDSLPSGDPPGDGLFDPNILCGQSGSECVEKFMINGAVKIANVWGCNNSGCNTDVGPDGATILFKRPYPEALLNPASDYSHYRITIQSTKDDTREKYIDIWNTGQIAVLDS